MYVLDVLQIPQEVCLLAYNSSVTEKLHVSQIFIH